MAASMCPVMSNSPGEGWLPPLTAPPLPASGVLGAVVLPGPAWMPGGPSPEDPELDPDVIGVVVEAVLVDPEAWAAVNATPRRSSRAGGVRRHRSLGGVAAAAKSEYSDQAADRDELLRVPGSPRVGSGRHPPTSEARMKTSSGARTASA